jgi:hypothetical protein
MRRVASEYVIGAKFSCGKGESGDLGPTTRGWLWDDSQRPTEEHRRLESAPVLLPVSPAARFVQCQQRVFPAGGHVTHHLAGTQLGTHRPFTAAT